MYIAFDPGKRTGWALFNSHGELVKSGILKTHFELDDFLNAHLHFPIRTIIYERYINNPAIKQGGSTMPQSIAIGRIQSFCYRHHIHYVEQPSSVLPIALRWAGIRQYKGHIPDDKSAIAHGIYWLQKAGIRRSRLLEEEVNK